jgi:hypothetical protein
MAKWVTGSIDWAAVSAVAAVVGLVVPLCIVGLKKLHARRTAPRTVRERTADDYLTQLKVTAKAIDDAVASRIELSTAQSALSELSAPEERLRRAFGNESAVHWIARLNREMLRRAFDIANGDRSRSGVSVSDLVSLGVDDAGFDVFERERNVAMQQRKPVYTFKSHPAYLEMMAELAQLPAPQRERFAELLAARQRSFEEEAAGK